MGTRMTSEAERGARMEMTGFESAVVLGACVLPLIRLVVAAVVGYFVVKKAVLAALREHEHSKGPQ